MQWPESVERVAAFLRETGAEARLEELGTETPTAPEAADAIGCTLGQVVKSLVLVCDGAPVVALVPGDRRADTGKVARLVGARRVAVARPEEVVAATGFRPGAVSPFPLERVSVVLVERDPPPAPDGLGRARGRTGTWWRCHPPSSCASRADASRTSCWNHHNSERPANGGKRCRRPRRSG